MSSTHPLLAVEEQLSQAFTAIENEEIISEAKQEGRLSPNGELDITETDERYEVSVSNISLDPGEVYSSVRDGSLFLWDRAFGTTDQNEVDENIDEAVEDDIITEEQISYGNCMVEIPLPSNIEADETLAEFMDGVLTVALPKVKAGGRRKNA